ncbi:hypothetical protein ALC53_10505, partial [Atta colombica]
AEQQRKQGGCIQRIQDRHLVQNSPILLPCGLYLLSLEFRLDGVGRHLRSRGFPLHPPCTFISLTSSLSCIHNQPPERSCYTESQLQQCERKRRRKKYRRRTRKRRRRKRRKKEME